MIIEEVTKIIELSFSKETCYPALKDKWNEENKT